MTKTFTGLAGKLTIPDNYKNSDDIQITNGPNYDGEPSLNLGPSNYNYLEPAMPIYADPNLLAHNEYVDKATFNNLLIKFMQHYRIPYSDHNVSVLAKYVLKNCMDGKVITDFINPDSSNNLYDIMLADATINTPDHPDLQDNEFNDNLDALVDYFKLDYGGYYTNRLIAWIKSCINSSLMSASDSENPSLADRSALTPLAYLETVSEYMKHNIPLVEKSIYRNYHNLIDHFDHGDTADAFNNEGLIICAKEIYDKYCDIEDWSTMNSVNKLLNELNKTF